MTEGSKGAAGRESRRRSGQDEVLVEALAQGLSYPRAGKLAGCSPRTVSRRVAEPEFARRVRERRGKRVGEILGLLTEVAAEAPTVISALMLEAEDDAVRLRAAQLALTLLERFRTQVDLEDRLRDLEGRVAFGEEPAE